MQKKLGLKERSYLERARYRKPLKNSKYYASKLLSFKQPSLVGVTLAKYNCWYARYTNRQLFVPR
jgi:hypothetical protein